MAGARDRVLCLVRRTAPSSPNTAAVRLSALCAFCATVEPGPDTALGEVLTVPAVNAFLHDRRGQVSDRQLANLSALLERLRCVAHGLPYRATNTADPGARSEHQRNKTRATPTAGNAALIEQVCTPRAVLAAVVEMGLTHRRLERAQPHLPTADLSAHLTVLRGETDNEPGPVVWQSGEVSAQVDAQAPNLEDC